MKLGKIIEALPALQKLAGQELTPKNLYRISKLLSKLDKEVEFFNNSRNKMIRDLGEEIKEGEWKVKEENIPLFKSKMDELMDIDIEGEIAAVSLPVTENIKLSYNDLKALEGFIMLEDAEEIGTE